VDLLRPPAHRGPLIAAGAVVLATGLLLAELRLAGQVADGVQAASAGAVATLLLALGWRARLEGGAPAAYQSVLLVTGLVLLGVALLRVAQALGAGASGYPSGALVWGSAVLGVVALIAGIARRSAICVFIAALAGVSVVLHAVAWLFSPGSATPYRVLLGVMAAALVLVSLVLRGGSYRTSVLLVDGAGLLVIAMGVTLLGFAGIAGPAEESAGTEWEAVVLVAGCGLAAFGAVDRQPGPAFLGAATLALFVALAMRTADDRGATLRWWPLLLIVLGGTVMAAGLRPRRPLPPEPRAYGVSDTPLALRSDEDDPAS